MTAKKEPKRYLGQTRVIHPVFTRGDGRVKQIWLQAGSYKIVREFDSSRLLIEVSPGSITLVDKKLTNWTEKEEV